MKFVVSLLASDVVRKLVIGTLRIVAKSTDNTLDDRVVEVVDALWRKDLDSAADAWFATAERLACMVAKRNA
jgi:hypothetical protein